MKINLTNTINNLKDNALSEEERKKIQKFVNSPEFLEYIRERNQ